MYALGKEFLKRFNINYEWVDNFSEELKYSPIQNVVSFENYVNPTDNLSPPGDTKHAVEGVFATAIYNEERDTYWQIFKRYNPAFTHSYMSFKLTINNNNSMDTAKFLKDNDLKWVRNSNTGAFGRIMQGKLFTIQTTDRAALILLDDKVRTNGITIPNNEWVQLPQANF
jgi:hypothetical protein